MGGGDKLAEVAAELLLRGVDTDKVLAILGERGAFAEPKRKQRDKAAHTPRSPRAGYVTHEQVLAALAGKSLTVDGLLHLLPDSSRAGMIRHVRRGVELGNMARVGTGEPITFALTKAGVALVAREAEIKRSKPPPGRQVSMTHAGVIDRLREIGPSTAQNLRRALGATCTDQAIRMHLKRGVIEGTVKRNDDEKPAIFAAVGVSARKRSGAPEKRMSPKGQNDRLIVTALAAAKEPLDAKGVKAAIPAFANAAHGTVYMALYGAVQRGIVKKTGSGRFALPSYQEGKITRRGKNDERIVAALTAAKGPLNTTAFIAVIPEFKRMSSGAQTMALSNAVKRGVVKRVANGLYALPSHKAAAYTAKVRANPKDPTPGEKAGPTKPESEPAKKLANGNGLNGAHAAPS